MSKLKLPAVNHEKPVKLTIELPGTVHSNLIAYAEAISRETGQPAPDPAKIACFGNSRTLFSVIRGQRFQ